MSGDGAHCPECGEPIDATASYCMHCYADLPDGPVGGDSGGGGGDVTDASTGDDDRGWGDSDDSGWANDGSDTSSGHQYGGQSDPTGPSGDDRAGSVTSVDDPQTADAGADPATTDRRATPDADDQVLDPDGLVDNTLTVIVGILGGIAVGIFATIALFAIFPNPTMLLAGVIAWLGSTAYLVRRRTVQGAIANTGYAIAVVLLLIPFAWLSPFATVEGGIVERVELVGVTLLGVAIPAGFFGVVGLIAAQFVPEEQSVG